MKKPNDSSNLLAACLIAVHTYGDRGDITGVEYDSARQCYVIQYDFGARKTFITLEKVLVFWGSKQPIAPDPE